jgi:hypothetical protein
MLASIKNIIECKTSKTRHIAQDPILLTCGYSACRKCYEFIKKCQICNEDHLINESQLKTNFLVKDMIEKNLEHLTTEIKEKYSSDKNKDVKSK